MHVENVVVQVVQRLRDRPLALRPPGDRRVEGQTRLAHVVQRGDRRRKETEDPHGVKKEKIEIAE